MYDENTFNNPLLLCIILFIQMSSAALEGTEQDHKWHTTGAIDAQEQYQVIKTYNHDPKSCDTLHTVVYILTSSPPSMVWTGLVPMHVQ